MLSALIGTVHSYPAVPLAGQLVHQRYVHLGPLVTYSHITMSADYIFTPVKSRLRSRGAGVLWMLKSIPSLLLRKSYEGSVVTGSFVQVFGVNYFKLTIYKITI